MEQPQRTDCGVWTCVCVRVCVIVSAEANMHVFACFLCIKFLQKEAYTSLWRIFTCVCLSFTKSLTHCMCVCPVLCVYLGHYTYKSASESRFLLSAVFTCQSLHRTPFVPSLLLWILILQKGVFCIVIMYWCVVRWCLWRNVSQCRRLRGTEWVSVKY